MTVIASAQRRGLNVRDHLSFILRRLADPAFKTGSLPELLPTRWRPGSKQRFPERTDREVHRATVAGHRRIRQTRLVTGLHRKHVRKC